MLKKILVFFLLIFFSILCYSEVLRYKFIPGTKFKVSAEIKGNYYIADPITKIVTASTPYVQKYKRISTIKDIKYNMGLYNDEYYYYIYNNLSGYTTLREIENHESVMYSLDPSGMIFVKTATSLPVLRNAPYFPDRDLKIGDEWEFQATEVQDFFNDGILSYFPIKVKYKFIGYENNKKVVKILYVYSINIINSSAYKIHNRIIKAVGKNSTMMYFDVQAGYRLREEYEKSYAFLIYDDFGKQRIDQMQDKGVRVWKIIEKMDKKSVEKDLKDNVRKEKLKDVEIEKDDKGVKITLENIQFDPDSSILREGEKKRLDKIAKILKKYKNKEILIKGHTTDRGTEEGRMLLSKERAKVVAEYLLKKNAIDSAKTSYHGVGDKEPIASNKLEDGMKKNRRVEIYILEE